MGYIMNFLCTNARLKKMFERFLKIEANKSPTYYQYGSYGNRGAYNTEFYCYENDLNATKEIVFFEWSTLNGTQRHFKNLKDFYLFLKSSKIDLPTYDLRSKIIENNIVYTTCKRGKASIIASNSKTELSKLLEETNNK